MDLQVWVHGFLNGIRPTSKTYPAYLICNVYIGFVGLLFAWVWKLWVQGFLKPIQFMTLKHITSTIDTFLIHFRKLWFRGFPKPTWPISERLTETIVWYLFLSLTSMGSRVSWHLSGLPQLHLGYYSRPRQENPGHIQAHYQNNAPKISQLLTLSH